VIVLEGGFDDEGTLVYIPFSGLQSMVESVRRRVIKLLVARELLNEAFAPEPSVVKALRFSYRQQRTHPRLVLAGPPDGVHRAATSSS